MAGDQRPAGRAGRRRKGGKQVGFEEYDAIREAEAGGVALCYGESGGGDISSVDFGVGEFSGQGDGDAAGARADVDDGEAFAGEFWVAAGAEFADGEAVEGDFDEVLGFGAGDEDVGSNFEFEAPEFLFAREVLGGFTGGVAVKN